MRRLIALSAFTILALVAVTRADFVLGPGLYDNTAPVLTYAGAWDVDVLTSYYLDSAAYGDSLDSDSLSFSFYGNAFTIYVALFNSGGNVAVCIDEICSNASMFASPDVYRAPITYTGLALGVHEVEIIPDENGIYFDALFIHGYAVPTAVIVPTATTSPTPTETPTLEFTETPTATPTALPWIEYQVTDSMGQAQTVRYTYSTDSGQITIILFLFALFLLGVIGVVFQIWRYFDGRE